jgi:hypothetical protein
MGVSYEQNQIMGSVPIDKDYVLNVEFHIGKIQLWGASSLLNTMYVECHIDKIQIWGVPL